jgi:hypothetical protein
MTQQFSLYGRLYILRDEARNKFVGSSVSQEGLYSSVVVASRDGAAIMTVDQALALSDIGSHQHWWLVDAVTHASRRLSESAVLTATERSVRAHNEEAARLRELQEGGQNHALSIYDEEEVYLTF